MVNHKKIRPHIEKTEKLLKELLMYRTKKK